MTVGKERIVLYEKSSASAEEIRLESPVSAQQFCCDWEGYIWKKGHLLKNWRYRYAIFHNGIFTYYLSKELAMSSLDKCRGRVQVTSVYLDVERENGICFDTTIGKLFHILTRTKIECLIWVRIMQNALSDPHSIASEQQLPEMAIRTSLDWSRSNYSTIQCFYDAWAKLSSQDFQDRFVEESLLDTLFQLFSKCTDDIHVETTASGMLQKNSKFYGREGILQYLLVFPTCTEFTQVNILTTNKPNVVQVLGKCTFPYDGVVKKATWKHDVVFSPAGRVYRVTMDLTVNQSNQQAAKISTALPPQSKKSFAKNRHNTGNNCDLNENQYTNSKRVLSLSIQHFSIKGVLGKGTFGTVVLAENKRSKEIVAIKILDKNSMTEYDKIRVRTEMRILRDIYHPFIAGLRFSFQNNSRVFLGMKYYAGGSLYSHINSPRSNGHGKVKIKLDLERVRFYAAQLVLALSHLHSCGIVYRDLKPDNIMIDEDGNLCLVDFGLSKANVESSFFGAKTMAGSPAYTSPELLVPRSRRTYGTAIDWWCLGVVIYEMLYGQRPFHHSNVSALYRLIEKEPVRFPTLTEDTVDDTTKSLISGLLQKDPKKRLGSSTRGLAGLLAHPFFRIIQWESLLKKQPMYDKDNNLIPIPWKPDPLVLERKLKGSGNQMQDVEFFLRSNDHLQQSTHSKFHFWKNLMGGTSRHLRKRRETFAAHQQHHEAEVEDVFRRFSYVSDSTTDFLVDEEELLDSIFSGRKSTQFDSLATLL